MRKIPKKSGLLIKCAKIFLLAELGLVAATLPLYLRMNRHPDFRHYMHEKYPRILNIYYLIGEKIGGTVEIRRSDYQRWGIIDK